MSSTDFCFLINTLKLETTTRDRLHPTLLVWVHVETVDLSTSFVRCDWVLISLKSTSFFDIAHEKILLRDWSALREKSEVTHIVGLTIVESRPFCEFEPLLIWSPISNLHIFCSRSISHEKEVFDSQRKYPRCCAIRNEKPTEHVGKDRITEDSLH